MITIRDLKKQSTTTVREHTVYSESAWVELCDRFLFVCSVYANTKLMITRKCLRSAKPTVTVWLWCIVWNDVACSQETLPVHSLCAYMDCDELWPGPDHTICQVQYYKLPFFGPCHFLNELKWSIHWLSIVIVNGSNVGSMTRRSLEPAGSCEEILSPTWSNKLYQSDWTYLDISYEFDWKLIVFCANKVDLILSEGTHSAMLM